MARNLKYQWCKPDTLGNKEFLGWVYDRLQNKGDNLMDGHMKRLDDYIDKLSGTIPDGPKSEEYLNAYKEGFKSALNVRDNFKLSILGLSVDDLFKAISEYEKRKSCS